MELELESGTEMKIEEIEGEDSELETAEQTLGDIFDEIAEGLAGARTSALMGERETALGLLQKANLDYTRFREILRGYPGFLALERDLEMSKAALCADRERTETLSRMRLPKPVRSRRKTDRAA